MQTAMFSTPLDSRGFAVLAPPLERHRVSEDGPSPPQSLRPHRFRQGSKPEEALRGERRPSQPYEGEGHDAQPTAAAGRPRPIGQILPEVLARYGLELPSAAPGRQRRAPA